MYPQFYHTRCAAEQSVIGQAGFTVRGSSLDAEEVIAKRYHQSLVQLSAYELPADQHQTALAGNLSVKDAPVRLSRIKLDDQFALVHSVFRPDAGERKVNYFSHAIIMPCNNSLSAAQCLQTWGTSGSFGDQQGWVWQDEANPRSNGGASLPTWSPETALAEPHLQSDAALNFLRGEKNGEAPQHPSLLLSPERLQGKSNEPLRRQFVECLLALFLDRKRVVLIGEPGLAALLFFTLTKLIPDELLTDFTFSTYESLAHCTENKLDVVNTWPGPMQEETNTLTITDPDVLTLDTSASLEEDTLPISEQSKTYARRAVEFFLNGQLEELKQFWQFASDLNDGQSQSRDVFLDAWKKWHRVTRNIFECDLSEQEVEDYLGHEITRALLFKFSTSSALAVEYILTRDISWWPNDPIEAQKTPSLAKITTDDLSELIVTQTVATLESGQDPKLRITGKCINTLLSGLLGANNALPRFLEVLKTRDYKPKECLTWKDHFQLLTLYAQASAERAQSQAPPLSVSQTWLEVSEESQLVDILQLKNMPEDWKTKAIILWLLKQNTYTASLSKILFKNSPLLYASLKYIAAHKSDASETIIANIFRAQTNQSLQVEFCKYLLSAPWISQHTNFRQGLVQCLIALDESNIQWETFFGDDQNSFLALADSNVEILVELLSLLSEKLEPCCIRQNDTRHTMLKSFLKLHGKLSLITPPEKEESQQFHQRLIITLEHWKVIYAATYEQFPARDSWARLRWAIAALQFDEPALLTGLTSQLQIPKQLEVKDCEPNESYLEIANCAEIMAAKGSSPRGNLIASSRILISSVDQLPILPFSQRAKDFSLAILLQSLCGTGQWMEHMINEIKLGLKEDGIEIPIGALKFITSKRRVRRKKAAKRKTLRALFFSFLPACGIILVTLAIVTAERSFPELFDPWASKGQILRSLIGASLFLNIIYAIWLYYRSADDS